MADSPRRVQLRRTKGWRMPANTVKVDRSTKWGNPYTGRDLDAVVQHYRDDLLGHIDPTIQIVEVDRLEVIAELAEKNLACWCPLDAPCHADVLLAIANPGEPTDE